MAGNQPSPRILVRDDTNDTWLRFTSPCQIVTTMCHDQVLPCMSRIEDAVRHDGLYAAGFVAYEAAPGFDSSLPVKHGTGFPLLWFGLFETVDRLISLPPADEKAIDSLPWQPSVTPDEYRHCLSRIRDYIANGDTYQVNYTFRLRAAADIDPWLLFHAIAGDEGAPFAAFVDTGEWAICSASPELFLKIDGDLIESRPMKGTLARGLWFEDDQAKKAALGKSEKDRAENVMIVDMVRNDLGRIAPYGSVRTRSLFDIEQYPTVWQMTSTVCARSAGSLCTLFEATFPPASITGAPKRRTMEIIEELETSPRRIYTGAIGFMTPENRAQFNVAIRTVLIEKATGAAEYGVGGGIVWDSKPADEFEECIAKSRVLKPRPWDFDLLETILWSPPEGFTLLGYHLKRLVQSGEYFGFHIDIHAIQRTLEQSTQELAPLSYKIRLLVSRSGAHRCETISLDRDSFCFEDIILAGSPIDRNDPFLYHKTTHRQAYARARDESGGANDVLLYNSEGQITESTIANVAVEIDGVLYTPPVRCGLLPGTQRAWLLAQGRLKERIIHIQEALNSPTVFLLNSVRGMHRVHITQK